MIETVADALAAVPPLPAVAGRLTVTGLPVGSRLADGVRSLIVGTDQSAVDLAGWNLRALAITPPVGGEAELQVRFTTSTRQRVDGVASSVSRTLLLQTAALAQVPSLVLLPAKTEVSRRVLAVGRQALSGDGLRGIERSIATLEGAQYTLSFAYAGGPGSDGAGARIGVWLDEKLVGQFGGQPIGQTGGDAVDRQVFNTCFAGNGRAMALAIRLEGATTATTAMGGVLLDDLAVIETLPNGADTVYGLIGSAIRLPGIEARLADGDGDAALRVEVMGLPVGAVLGDGVRMVKVANKPAPVDMSGWRVDRLMLGLPGAYPGDIALQVRASATATIKGSQASIARDLTVRVLPGIACATPPGVNPLVRYVNHAAVIIPARPVLVAGPLRGEARGGGILVPRVPSPAHRDIEDADRDLDDRWRGLENGLSEAFSAEMGRVLAEGKQ